MGATPAASHALAARLRSAVSEKARGKVDVVPAERLRLSESQAGVERRRPDRPILNRQGLEQRRGLDGIGYPLPPPTHNWKLDACDGFTAILPSRLLHTLAR